MTESIKPALTPGEWAEFLGNSTTAPTSSARALMHKHAALALYGQPFGFTNQDAADLHLLWQKSTDPKVLESLDRIIGRIDALLPPLK